MSGTCETDNDVISVIKPVFVYAHHLPKTDRKNHQGHIRSVYDLIDKSYAHYNSIGGLDRLSEGLVLLSPSRKTIQELKRKPMTYLLSFTPQQASLLPTSHIDKLTRLDENELHAFSLFKPLYSHVWYRALIIHPDTIFDLVTQLGVRPHRIIRIQIGDYAI